MEDNAGQDDLPVNVAADSQSSRTKPPSGKDFNSRRGSDAISSPPSPPNASESCRLCVSNLPKFFGMGELKKYFLNKFGITVKQVKPVKDRARANLCFVTFSNGDDMRAFQDKLSTCMFKGKVLKAERADQAPNKFHRAVEQSARNRRNADANSSSSSAPKTEQTLNITEIVAPLHNVRYDPEQLRLKVQEIVAGWKKYGTLFQNKAQNSMPWLQNSLKQHSGMLCELRSIVKLPWATVEEAVLSGKDAALKNSKCLFRNKCEFTFGFDAKGAAEVGFRVAKFRQGNITVEFPASVPFISPSMQAAAHHMRSLLFKTDRPHPLQPFNEITKVGHYRQLTVRENRKGQLLVAVYLHPQKLTAEELDVEFEALRQHFLFTSVSDAETSTNTKSTCYCCSSPVDTFVNVKSLIVVAASGSMPASFVKDSPTDTTRILIGDGYIEEQLLDLTFRISHSSFFQTNAYGAENLYQTILDGCSTTSGRAYSTMFDLCCGTGTISLLAAKALPDLKRIIGIESNADAVRDAQCNAELSGVVDMLKQNQTELEFIPALVELALPEVARKFGIAEDVSDAPARAVAVLDPPRSGVQASVIDALRKCDAVERVIYAACAPTNEQVMQNVYRLCRCSRDARGESFRPTYAVPLSVISNDDVKYTIVFRPNLMFYSRRVDLFPFTKHCELIIVFDRYNEEAAVESTATTVAAAPTEDKAVDMAVE